MNKILLTLICILSFSLISIAQTSIWVGGATGDWNTASNWQSGILPASGDVVQFNSNVTVTAAAGVTITPAQIQVTGGNTVTLDLDLTIGNGSYPFAAISGEMGATVNFGTPGSNRVFNINVPTNQLSFGPIVSGVSTYNIIASTTFNVVQAQHGFRNGIFNNDGTVNVTSGVFRRGIFLSGVNQIFTNNGILNIQAPNSNGIELTGGSQFVNNATGVVSISNFNFFGIFVQANSTATNLGTITISGGMSNGSNGIDLNGGTFNNGVTGIINIDDVNSNGIRIRAGAATLTNDGNINITDTQDNINIGIQSFATLTNTATGVITIAAMQNNGISVAEATTTNDGVVNVTGSDTGGTNNAGLAVVGTGTFINNCTGVVNADGGTNTNTGRALFINTNGTINNFGLINATGGRLVQRTASQGTFINEAGGVLDMTDGRFSTFGGATFINNGLIKTTFTNSGVQANGAATVATNNGFFDYGGGQFINGNAPFTDNGINLNAGPINAGGSAMVDLAEVGCEWFEGTTSLGTASANGNLTITGNSASNITITTTKCAMTVSLVIENLPPPTPVGCVDNDPPMFTTACPADVAVECNAVPMAVDLMATDDCGFLSNNNNVNVVFINEIHYEDIGPDMDEFVEIAGTAGLNLAGYTLELYNGATGGLYGGSPINLTGIIPNEAGGAGAIDFQFSTNGLQNGSPDGLALVDPNGVVLEFLSYEGTFTATAGSANGMTSTDIGVNESNNTPNGQSLQLTGTGSTAADFTWTGPTGSSPGLINVGQTIELGGTIPGPISVSPVDVFVAGSCANEGTITRTWTAEDATGKTTVCTQIITIEDNTPPTALCQDISVELDVTGNITITPAQIDNGSSDLCGDVNLSLDVTDFTCQDIGTNTVNLTVTDDCGNTSTCSATVTVMLNAAATITDITVIQDLQSCDGSTNLISADITVTFNNPPSSGTLELTGSGTASVNVAMLGSTTSHTFFGVLLPANNSTINLTATFSDCAGFSFTNSNAGTTPNTCAAINPTISQTDPGNGDPSILDPCSCGDPLNEVVGGVLYFHDFVTITSGPGEVWSITAITSGQMLTSAGGAAFNVGDVLPEIAPGVYMIDLWTEAGVGFNAEFNRDVAPLAAPLAAGGTCDDTVAPTATCQDITVQLDADGNGSITPADIDNGSTDDCTPNNLTLAIDNMNFSCQNVGANTVTLTVTDLQGNSSTCTATVTVEDTVPPVITCPADQTIHLDPGACESVYSYEVTATDNCEFMLTTTFLSTTLNDNNGFAGNMFDVEAIGPSAIGINSFDMNLDVQGASVDVSVWYTTTDNTFAGNETNAGAWTLLGSATVVSNGAGMATTVPVGGLTLAAGEAKGIYVATTNGNFMLYTNGNGANQNYSDANLSIETGVGRGAPAFSGGIFNPRVWNGNIHYTFLAPAAPLVTLTAGLPSGSAFPIGTSTQTHVATDGQGNTSTCSFSVTVVEYVPSSTDITCNNLIHISLDENCQSVVGADQVLEGNNYGCYDNYPVTFADGPQQGQPVVLGPGNVGQTINVMVTNPSGNPCWGQILVEDKLIPDLVCTDVDVRCDEPTTPGATVAATIDYPFATLASVDNATVTETVVVGEGDEVLDLNVNINTTHTWVGDLVISVTSPSGTTVELLNNLGGPGFGCNNAAGQNMDVMMDDEATATYADMNGQCPPTGTFQPLQLLSAFDGEPAQGTWTISVQDLVAGDGGDVTATLELKAANSGTVAYPVPASATVIPAGPNTFTVIGFDPCGPATLVYSDSEDGDVCAGTQAITRSWTITDGYNNTSSCTQTINIAPTTIADVAGNLPADITLECGDALPAPLTTLGGCDNIAIALDGAPTVIDICGGGFKMLRKYVVVDWCTNETMDYIQLIKVEDTQDPILSCPADITVSTTNNSCVGNVSLVMPTATDCGGGVTFTMEASAGTINGNLLVELPIGEHTVTFTGTDDCGNAATCTQKITVEDNVSPTAVCDEHTIVALGSDGTALVNATTFDDGSNDNCGIVSMEARRMDNPNCPGFDGTSFGPTVPFYCCDVNSTIMVEFRITDAGGLTNSCMVEVEVQDKMAPIIACKPDITIDCDNPIIADIAVNQPLPASAIALTGSPAVTDNCSATVTSNVFFSNVDNCGNGVIRVLWSAVDGGGLFDNCEQKIFITDANPFDGNSIVWPQDYEANTCGIGLEPEDLATPYNYPTWNDGTCSNVASTHEDTVLDFGADGACLKVLRKWIVIDWCSVPTGADPTNPNTTGVWHYTQIIKVLNSTAPVIETFNGATTIDNFDSDCGNVFAAFDITASDDCTASNLLEYSWSFSTGTSGTGTSASGNFANGTYTVTFSVNDQCGNTSTDSRTFTVADAKKPTPVCIFGIASTVMPSAGAVTIWASDFESGSSFDNCTDYNDLAFSFSPNTSDDNLVITCADIPADGLVPVTLFVTDANGNNDFCTTFIQVQDPNGACPPIAATIFGTVETEDQEVVEDVMVTVNDANGPMVNPVVTGVNGTFAFNTTIGTDYEVEAEKDINYLNGVTTYDLVLISKHILGTELLDSPYKIIAADANHSESLTALDIVKLRALILHIDDELANNDSWRFVDANYTFINPNNPLAENFPEHIALDPSTIVPSNFTGIKIGDVNGTASPNSLLGTETRTMNGKLALQAKATTVAAGETFTVDFTAKDFNNIAGYQFTLGFDNNVVEFVDVTSNLEGLEANNFGLTKVEEGVITTSWNSNKGVSVENNEVIFSVTFTANAIANTQDIISINSRYTATEAYNGSDLFDVVLEFNGTQMANGFELYQNTPNPFKAETMIGFNLPEAGEVTLKVFDVSGRILRLIEMDAAKGYNAVDLDRNGIDATGVLYYQLETATETATKKMIIVD